MNQTHGAIYEEFRALRPHHRNHQEVFEVLANQYGLSPHTVRHIVADQTRLRDILAEYQDDEPPPAAAPEPTYSPPLANYPPDELEDDSLKIHNALLSLARLDRPARVYVVSDEHFPDHDPRAIVMNILISRWFDPDLLIFNGDTFDFSEISAFQIDRRHGKRDILKSVERLYTGYARSMQGRYKVLLDGNHNRRLEAFNNLNWQLADTVEEAYAELVRAGGNVMWLNGSEELDVGALYVHHGVRVGVNAAKLSLETDLGGSVSVIQGHTHGVGMYVKSVKRLKGHGSRVVTSVVSGFAGKKPSAYQSRGTAQSKWIHSSCVYHVDVAGDMVNPQIIVYHESADGSLTAFCGSQVFQVDAKGKIVDG